MKKLMTAAVVMALVIVGTLSVSAAEVEEDFVSRMDAETFIELRTAQINAADITEEVREELLAHINEVAEEGLFGNGPENGNKGDGNAECILGENDLGIFRSESAGQRTGEGNGVGLKLQDGTGTGQGNRVGNRSGGQGLGGNGLADGSAAGAGYRGQGNNGECVLED